jgi:serine/threonine-protein kinase
MSTSTLATFVSLLRKSQILSAEQLEEVERDLQPRYPDAKSLAKALIERNWVTAYQVNQLSQGRSRDFVLGQYTILDRLGEGGMGQVFKARHRSMGRVVALKVLRRERLANPDALRRFHREIQAAARLSHPNVVLAYDADHYNNTHFFVMEYVDGIDLAKLVRKTGPVSVNRACNYIYQAALGLAHAQEHGLVHRDIKPHNLLLTRDGTIKILDMGLARLGHADTDSDVSALTQDGKVVGTPDYIAPEQARNAHSADIRADLYSLGCTLYFILSGRVPFPGGSSLMEKLMKHQTEDPVPLRSVRPDIPEPVAAIVHKLMQRRPEDRYQKPEEVAAALEPFAFAAGGDTSATVDAAGMKSQPVLDLTATPSRTASATPSVGSSLASGRRRMDLWIGAAAALVMVGAVLVLGTVVILANRTQPLVKKNGEEDNGSPKTVARYPLDRLKAADIPEDKRPPDPMAGLVAVLGEPRGQHWGPGMATRPLYSPDGRLLSSYGGFGDGYLRLWDPKSLREVGHLQVGNGLLNWTFAADSREIITMAVNGQARVWDVSPGGLGKRPGEYRLNPQIGVAFSSDGKTAAGVEQEKDIKKPKIVKVWEAHTGKVIQSFEIPEGFVFHLGFSTNGRRLLSVTTKNVDGKHVPAVKIWDFDTKRERTFDGFQFVRGQPQLTPDGRAMVVLGTKWAYVFDVNDGKVLHKFDAPNGFFSLLSPNGKQLAITTHDPATRKSSVLVYDMLQGKKLASIDAVEVGFGSVQFTPDSRIIAAVSVVDGGMRLWETTNFKELPALKDNLSAARIMTFAPDNRHVAFGTGDPSVRVWDLTTGKEIITGQTRMGSTFAALIDDQTLLTAGFVNDRKSPGHNLRKWDLTAQKDQIIARDRSNGGGTWAYDPVHRLVVGASMISENASTSIATRLYDVETGAERGVLPPPEPNSWVAGLAFSPDGKALATSIWRVRERQSVILLRDPTDGREIMRLQERAEQVHILKFTPDGKLLLALGRDGAVKLWDLTTKQEHGLPTVQGMGTQTNCAAFSPDGTLLATGYAPGGEKLQFWDVRTRTLHKKLSTRPLLTLAFRPDSKAIATFDSEGSLDVYDIASGKSLHHWIIGGPVQSLHFSKDGRYLFTANGNGTVYIFRLEEPAT